MAAIDPLRTPCQRPVVSTGLIAGKPAPTDISPASRSAHYLWEPGLPAMGCEAAPAFGCPPWVDSSLSRLIAKRSMADTTPTLCSQYRPHRRQAGSHREITSLRACAVQTVGAALAGDGPRSGPAFRCPPRFDSARPERPDVPSAGPKSAHVSPICDSGRATCSRERRSAATPQTAWVRPAMIIKAAPIR